MTDRAPIEQPPERFCHNCGAANPAGFNFCPRCGARVNFLRPPPVTGVARTAPLPGAYPVRFDAECPERLSRWSTLIRIAAVFPVFWLSFLLGSLVPGLGIALSLLFLPFLPLYAFLWILSFLLFWCLFAYWITVLLRGRPVRWLFDTLVASQRFFVRAYTYLILLTDRYPPFEGDWPVRFEVDAPSRVSRWQLFFWKSVMSLPHFIVLTVLSLVVGVVTLIAWFAIMFTGRYPGGLYTLVAGWMRWYSRLGAYWMSLTDDFPPFSLSAEAGKGSRRSYILSALTGGVLFLLVIGGCAAAIATLPDRTAEVEVSYAGLQAGRPSRAVYVSGMRVSLLEVEDPHDPPLGPGARLVQFTIRMENEDAFFALVDEDDFRLKDSFGDSYGPTFITFRGSNEPPFDIDRGEQGNLFATFEVDELADPVEVTYEPTFVSFGLGDRVRFKFIENESRARSTRGSTPSAKTGTPSPLISPRTYDIIVTVDSGSAVPGAEPVTLAGIIVSPIEVQDPTRGQHKRCWPIDHPALVRGTRRSSLALEMWTAPPSQSGEATSA